MLSSLSDLYRMKLEFKRKWESHFIPSHSKVLKSFKLHSSFYDSNKQTINLIILLTFQNLGCYNPRNEFFQNRRRSGDLRAKAGGPQGAHKPCGRSQGRPAATRLVASLELPCPSSLAYIFPKIPETIRASTKPLFRRRKLPFSRDLIWIPFPVPCRRGLWSWRASSSTSSPSNDS